MDWLLSILVTGLICMGVYQLGRQKFSPRWGVRWAACTAIGAQLFYCLSVLGWREVLAQSPGRETFILVIITGVGGLLGWGAGYIWMMLPRWLNKPG